MNKYLNKKLTCIIAISTVTFSLLLSCSSSTTTSTKNSSSVIASVNGSEISSDDAKNLLIDGNNRVLNNNLGKKDMSLTRIQDLAKNGQHPFAVVLTCSDSRVAPEEIFDRSIGDLFIVRNAGNVIDPVTLGSIEYGAEHLEAPLVVVLGHSKCGAVKATVDNAEVSDNIKEIAKLITPAFNKVKESTTNSQEYYSKTEDENITQSLNAVNSSPVIKHLVESGKAKVISAKYNLETGKVTFY